MAKDEISERAKKFLFEHIDSAELLDVLLLLYGNRSQSWSANTISRRLYSNDTSIENRLQTLMRLNLVQPNPGAPGEFHFATEDADLEKTIHELANLNGTLRNRLLQMIFSPLKQARVIADGFRLIPKKTDRGGDDG